MLNVETYLSPSISKTPSEQKWCAKMIDKNFEEGANSDDESLFDILSDSFKF